MAQRSDPPWSWPWAQGTGRREEAAAAPYSDAQASAPVAADSSSGAPRLAVERGEPKQAVYLPFTSILVLSSFGVGFLSGMVSGAQNTALRYLAENAHRRPETVQGWYFYNKTKYYHMILGGAKRGMVTGLQMAGWVGGFCILDASMEKARAALSERIGAPSPLVDALGYWTDGAAAGSVTALAAVLAYRLPRLLVPRMLLLGAAAGGATGAMRDVRSALMTAETKFSAPPKLAPTDGSPGVAPGDVRPAARRAI
ncbi:hypothetical protein MSPP1_001220 [Malassezia sp. CBS 17886]|nr:hypothetical protein MSPP1_001220 [Malassezia sp. CBS 17886]